MAGLTGVLWVNEKQLSKQLNSSIAQVGGCRGATDSEELRMLYD